MTSAILQLDPVPTLLAHARAELSAGFDFSRPMRVSRAPGRLDVMGGIADYTGSLVAEATLDRAAAVLLQERSDRELQIFSFNLLDEHRPFTFRIPLDALAGSSADDLRREFAAPGRQWAAYIAGCLVILHEQGYLDLNDPKISGMNLAILSTVPLGAGVSSSAALEVASMLNFADHFGLARSITTEADRQRPGPGVALPAGGEPDRRCSLRHHGSGHLLSGTKRIAAADGVSAA